MSKAVFCVSLKSRNVLFGTMVRCIMFALSDEGTVERSPQTVKNMNKSATSDVRVKPRLRFRNLARLAWCHEPATNLLPVQEALQQGGELAPQEIGRREPVLNNRIALESEQTVVEFAIEQLAWVGYAVGNASSFRIRVWFGLLNRIDQSILLPSFSIVSLPGLLDLGD
jgi:hypothetical protein